MVIKASAGAEIHPLIEALLGSDPTRRDSAAARLSVIGARAVPRLLAAYPRAASAAIRIAILHVLEGLNDSRALPLARAALRGDVEVAIVATRVLRGLLDAREPGVSADALDPLVTVALSGPAPRLLRLAALEALRDMPPDVRLQLADALGNDADPVLREAASAPPPPPNDPSPTGVPLITAAVIWEDALQGRLPAQAATLAPMVAAAAAAAPLSMLQKLVDALRARELAETEAGAEWCALRGAVHQALALRGSRVAMYDLRESLGAASGPLPVSFLAAVHEVGDSACLEPLAMAHTQAATADEWWRQQLTAALRAIVAREKLSRRSAAIKRLAARWPAAVDAAFGHKPARRAAH